MNRFWDKVDAGLTQRVVAKKYGICCTTIHNIVSGKRWANE